MIDAYSLGNYLKQQIEDAIRTETSWMHSEVSRLSSDVMALTTMANLSIGPQGPTGATGMPGPPGVAAEVPKITLPTGEELTFEELGEAHIELLSRVEDMALQIEELLEQKEKQ